MNDLFNNITTENMRWNIFIILAAPRENPTWGEPSIHAELQLLGYDIVESSISKYIVTIILI
jgi:hypothetical protein